jgi:hypothetical protein
MDPDLQQILQGKTKTVLVPASSGGQVEMTLLIKRILISIMFVGTIGISNTYAETNDETASAWNYRQLVNLIFTTSPNWWGTRYNSNFNWNEVTEHDQANCTVRFRSGLNEDVTIDATVHFNGITGWEWHRFDQGRGELILKSDGLIFEGSYRGRSSNGSDLNSCSNSCDFLTPPDYGQWLPIVFRQLYTRFCKAGQ